MLSGYAPDESASDGAEIKSCANHVWFALGVPVTCCDSPKSAKATMSLA